MIAMWQVLVALCHAVVHAADGRCVVVAVWQTLQGQQVVQWKQPVVNKVCSQTIG